MSTYSRRYRAASARARTISAAASGGAAGPPFPASRVVPVDAVVGHAIVVHQTMAPSCSSGQYSARSNAAITIPMDHQQQGLDEGS